MMQAPPPTVKVETTPVSTTPEPTTPEPTTPAPTTPTPTEPKLQTPAPTPKKPEPLPTPETPEEKTTPTQSTGVKVSLKPELQSTPLEPDEEKPTTPKDSEVKPSAKPTVGPVLVTVIEPYYTPTSKPFMTTAIVDKELTPEPGKDVTMDIKDIFTTTTPVLPITGTMTPVSIPLQITFQLNPTPRNLCYNFCPKSLIDRCFVVLFLLKEIYFTCDFVSWY